MKSLKEALHGHEAYFKNELKVYFRELNNKKNLEGDREYFNGAVSELLKTISILQERPFDKFFCLDYNSKTDNYKICTTEKWNQKHLKK